MRYSLIGVTAAAALLPHPAFAADAIELHGVGAQVYICEAAAGGFAWRFQAPDARLLDATGKEFGRHFAGPSWQAQDGSAVVGEVIASSPAPRPGAIPWLVLRAKSHSGEGVLASVGYIIRIDTDGGVAPSVGCDAGHVNAEARAPYSAIYVFLVPS